MPNIEELPRPTGPKAKSEKLKLPGMPDTLEERAKKTAAKARAEKMKINPDAVGIEVVDLTNDAELIGGTAADNERLVTEMEKLHLAQAIDDSKKMEALRAELSASKMKREPSAPELRAKTERDEKHASMTLEETVAQTTAEMHARSAELLAQAQPEVIDTERELDFVRDLTAKGEIAMFSAKRHAELKEELLHLTDKMITLRPWNFLARRKLEKQVAEITREMDMTFDRYQSLKRDLVRAEYDAKHASKDPSVKNVYDSEVKKLRSKLAPMEAAVGKATHDEMAARKASRTIGRR